MSSVLLIVSLLKEKNYLGFCAEITIIKIGIFGMAYFFIFRIYMEFPDIPGVFGIKGTDIIAYGVSASAASFCLVFLNVKKKLKSMPPTTAQQVMHQPNV